MIALLFGGNGMLGREIKRELIGSGIDVFSPAHSECDILNELQVTDCVLDFSPDFVINAAAFTNVDKCEEDVEQANKVNCDAVKIIGRASKINGSKLIHISTDYVFDGKKQYPESYSEDDRVNPIQYYGVSKLNGERMAMQLGGLVLRVQWLYGHGKMNFVDWIASSLTKDNQPRLPIFSSQAGSPSSCNFVASAIVKCLDIDTGRYHLSHDDFCTRRDVAEFVASYFNKNPEDVFEWRTDVFPSKAQRPTNTCLNNFKLQTKIGSLGSWRDDLMSYLTFNY